MNMMKMTIGHLEKKRDAKLHQKSGEQEITFQQQIPFVD
jgi:hypothetical protein